MFGHWKRPLSACVLLAASLFGLSGAAHAGYSGMVVFGDSLSDTGNVLSLTTAASLPPSPSLPSAPGRFSDGAVWTEYLAAGLGLANGAKNSNLIFNGTGVSAIGAPGGGNYAFGGARTGLGGAAGATTGMLGQLAAWNGAAFSSSLSRAADPDALYVVFAGANDLRDARNANPGASSADEAARAAAAATTAQNIVNIVGMLSQAGARHFLLSNLPDLGKTPEAAALGVAAASTDITLEFNAALAADIAALDALFLATAGVDLDLRMMDFYGLNEAMVQDALTNGGGVYGITNVTSPCITPVAAGAYFYPGSVANGCASAAYSDPLHPSSAAHALLGQLALGALPVPEPGSLALVACGLAAAFGSRRLRRR